MTQGEFEAGLRQYASGDIRCPYIGKKLKDMTDHELLHSLYLVHEFPGHYADRADIIIGRWLNARGCK